MGMGQPGMGYQMPYGNPNMSMGMPGMMPGGMGMCLEGSDQVIIEVKHLCIVSETRTAPRQAWAWAWANLEWAWASLTWGWGWGWAWGWVRPPKRPRRR
jgi:hypothetical protein